MKRLPLAALLALLLIPSSAVAQHHGGSHPRKKASGTGVRCGNGYISSSYTCHKGDDASTNSAAPEQNEPSSTDYGAEQQRADSETVAAEREIRERRAAWLAQHPGDTTTETENRDAEGHIIRSEAARRLFMAQTGYPKGREGYVIDHVKPLACGGADDPSNMQWQTVEEAQAKDKVERLGCHR